MWCKLCQQDVPATAAPESGELTCPRCRGVLRLDLSARAASSAEGSPSAVAEGSGKSTSGVELPLCDTWELEEHLRHLDRILQPHLNMVSVPPVAKPSIRARVDASHSRLAQRHVSAPTKPTRSVRQGEESAFITLAWFVLAMGLMMGSCGGMLWVWSLVMERPELWSVGMPIAVAGQVTLLLGLVLQLDRLRRQHRHTSVQLEQVDEQLHDLKKRRMDRGIPAVTARTHRVPGVATEPLLTGLKEQLDQLSAKIARLKE